MLCLQAMVTLLWNAQSDPSSANNLIGWSR